SALRGVEGRAWCCGGSMGLGHRRDRDPKHGVPLEAGGAETVDGWGDRLSGRPGEKNGIAPVQQVIEVESRGRGEVPVWVRQRSVLVCAQRGENHAIQTQCKSSRAFPTKREASLVHCFQGALQAHERLLEPDSTLLGDWIFPQF